MIKIPEFKINLEPISDEARKLKPFKWADENIGKRHKLGGEPEFIQGEDIPECASCGKKMIFYAQLDSLNDDFCIADCGMIYVFVCLDCNESKSIIQSF